MEAVFILVTSLGLAYYAYHVLKKKIVDEIAMVQNLATRRGWYFVKNPDAQSFADVAGWIGLQANAIRVLYFVNGSMNGIDFELFLVVGSPKSVLYSMNSMTISYATVVRTHAVLPSNMPQKERLSTGTYGNWNYIIYGANAMTQTAVLDLLGLLTA